MDAFSSNVLKFPSNFKGSKEEALQKLKESHPGMPKHLRRLFSSELFLNTEFEELERINQRQNTGLQKLWESLRTGGFNLPHMRFYIQKEMLQGEAYRSEKKCNSYVEFLRKIGRKKAKRKPSEPDVIWDHPSEESTRLQEDKENNVKWRTWGPYLSERQWGTVREDYSADGNW